MKAVLVVLVLVLVGYGGYKYFWPKKLPNLVLKDSKGSPVDLAQMRDGKQNLAMVVILPQCPISKFSLGVVEQQHRTHSKRVAFVGLMLGNQPAADEFRKKRNLAFPVYGLRDAPDPHLINEFVKKVGTNNRIWGGTVVVLDRKGKIVMQLEKEEVKELPQKLASL